MKILRFFILLTLLSTVNAFSQTENYKLDSYVNPNFKRQSLDFNLGGTGNFTSRKVVGNFDSDWDDQSLSGALSLGYNLVKNSERVQNKMNAKIQMNGAYTDNESESKAIKNYTLNLMFDNEAYYYKENKKFIEFSPLMSLLQQNNKDKGSVAEDNQKYFTTTLSFKLGIGKGRIEHVEDARQAIYILSELQNNKSLKKVLTEEEVNALAQQMTSIKYKRQFDSRVKLIQEISTVDSFLVANGYVDETNSAPYFTALYDNWLYAGLIERLSGTRFSMGVAPKYYFSQLDFDYNNIANGFKSDGKWINSELAAGIYAAYEYEKPINLYWQRSAGIEVRESYGERRDYEAPYWRTDLYANFKMGYYPNSRTYMAGSINQALNWMDEGESRFLSSYSAIAFEMYYYLSPQLRLGTNCDLSYNYYKHQGSTTSNSVFNKYPNFSFNFSLTYSIF